MRIHLDARLIQLIESHNGHKDWKAFQDISLKPDHENRIIFNWPTFLNYIGLGSVFENFLKFEEGNRIFAALVAALHLETNKDSVFELYDKVFAEFLTQVKSLPQIDQKFLLEQIKKKRQSAPFIHTKELFSFALDRYQALLTNVPYIALHDLILYLAWDRMCANLAVVFEHPSTDQTFQKNLRFFLECLLESFEHITRQGKTSPGFFRFAEAFYAYQMREERLQLHRESEWLLLCQCAPALKPREALVDLFYIDAAVVENDLLSIPEVAKDVMKVFTLDPPDTVKAALSLAQYTMKRIRQDLPEWPYNFMSADIICLSECEGGLFVDSTVSSKGHFA